jgi:hypothetical protein
LTEKTGNNEPLNEYKQECKSAEAKILGLEWLSDKQIAYTTDQGIELYQLNPSKKTVKFIRSVYFEPTWFIYYAPSQLIIAASGASCCFLNPFVVQNGVIHKLTQFTADFGCSRWKLRLAKNDVMVASM